MDNKEIYIVITQTGAIISRMLKKITGDEYNHVSLSLRSDLRCMYSFGRRNAYNPWWGGFVKESPEYGTFKRFSETRAIVLAVPVTEESYNELQRNLDEMERHKYAYHYDFLGVVLAGMNIVYKRNKHYYCSDFVRDQLVEFGIENSDVFEPIVRPIHFLDIPDGHIIYRGKLRDFSPESVRENAS